MYVCMYYIVGTLKFSWPVLIPEYIRAHNYGKECNGLYFFHGPVHTYSHIYVGTVVHRPNWTNLQAPDATVGYIYAEFTTYFTIHK